MRGLLRWALIAGISLALIVAIAFAVGAALPAKIQVTRSVVINRPPENVFWVLNDYQNIPLWHPQFRGAAVLTNPGDKPVRWRATYTDGLKADIEVSEDNPPARYSERIADPNLPFSGYWTLEMERHDLTTKVTAHCTSELHRPLDRLLVRLFVKPNVDVEHILAGLKRRVETATITPTAATS